jgi:sigma-B regulation protein RsbU (phosphoserine phosphatase)
MVPLDQVQQFERLHEHREHLEEWVKCCPDEERELRLGPASKDELQAHLVVLGTAVEKAAEGTLGACSVCGGFVDDELLEMDYTACVCLDHLSPEEKRSLESELELAQSVQRSLLPQQVPDTPALETAAFSRPAQYVGGDYFDFFRFQNGAHGLAIGDVAGHGVSAGLPMAAIQTLLRTLIPTSNAPHDVVQHVNRLFIHNLRYTTFVALFLGAFDPESLTLTYCNAGHTPPLLYRESESDGVREHWLMPTGAAIGLVEDDTLYGLGVIQLQIGDILLFCTDGVTEAINPSGEQFGWQRLAQSVSQGGRSSARDLVRRVRQDLEKFTQGQPQDDDITLVVCRING